MADGVDAIVDSLEGIDEVASHLSLDNRLCISTFHRPHHLSISNMELFLYISSEDVPIGLDILFQFIGNGNDKHSITRNSVVQFARIELSQTNALVFIDCLI